VDPDPLILSILLQALSTLLTACPDVYKACLPKMAECCVAYFATKDKDSDKEKVGEFLPGSFVDPFIRNHLQDPDLELKLLNSGPGFQQSCGSGRIRTFLVGSGKVSTDPDPTGTLAM